MDANRAVEIIQARVRGRRWRRKWRAAVVRSNRNCHDDVQVLTHFPGAVADFYSSESRGYRLINVADIHVGSSRRC